jgi:membrane-associated phospholipid phosphatase
MRFHSTVSLRALCVVAAVAPIFACDPNAGPSRLTAPLVASRSAATQELASPVWQGIEAHLVAQANLAAVVSTRAYSLLGVAQYLAVQRAEGSGRDGRSRDGSDAGAVAGASVVVLSYLFPSQAQALEDTVKAQRGAGPGFARGEVIGRAVGAEIVARAQTDGFSTPFTGTIPAGAGFWVSNTAPATVAGGPLPGVRPWFLESARQFRPGRPPAFGSPAFLAGLAEIRHISDTRTAEQIAIATFWAQSAGTPTTAGFWLQIATDGIQSHRLSERQATHVYALLGASMFDAQIGCWDAKETYWLIRPWQADPGITVVAAVGKPNHPSYPSGHSCISSSAAAVLTTFFPEQRRELSAMVTEAGLSRMYGGIHYRFDIEAGQQLGRSVARFAMRADRSGRSVLTPDPDHERHGGR